MLPFLAAGPVDAPPFFVTNTIAGFALLAFVAWVTAADVRRYRALAYTLLAMLLLGAVIYGVIALSPVSASADPVLVSAGVLLVAGGLLLALLILEVQPQAPAWTPWLPDKPLSNWERVGQVVL